MSFGAWISDECINSLEFGPVEVLTHEKLVRLLASCSASMKNLNHSKSIPLFHVSHCSQIDHNKVIEAFFFNILFTCNIADQFVDKTFIKIK